MIKNFHGEKPHNDLPDTPVPYAALVLYKQNEELCLTHHKVVSGQLQVGVPMPISEVVDQLKPEKNMELHATDPEILASNPRHRIWWRPRRIAPMWFRADSKAINLVVEWPPLLLHKVNGGKLYVFALPFNKRPSADTKLYAAPIANMHAPHDLCCPPNKANPFAGSPLTEVDALLYDSNFNSAHRRVDFDPDRKGNTDSESLREHIKKWRRMCADAKDNAKPKRVTAGMMKSVTTFGDYLSQCR